MEIIQVDINSKINSSLQIGDMAFVSVIGEGGIIGDPVPAGEIVEINSSGLGVLGEPGVIQGGHFLSFAKDIRANESSLKGYYADFTFVNASSHYAELFAVSSETALSSK